MRRRAFLLVAAASPAWATETWRIVTEYPATSMPGEGVAYFADALNRAAAGLTLMPGYDAPDGLKSAAMPGAVAAGQVQAADAFTGALADATPLFQLSALPFLTASAADTVRLLHFARPAYTEALAALGLTLLYATPWPATGLWSRTPVIDAAALQGLRVRTYDAASTAVLRGAGAAPEQISFAAALLRLRDGSLDAVLSSGDGGAGARLWEVLPHFTVLDYASPLSLAFCGTAVLAALPGRTQDAIRTAAAQTETRQFNAIRTRTAENAARLAANGVTVAPGTALRTALLLHAEPVIAAWAAKAGPDAAAALRAYRG